MGVELFGGGGGAACNDPVASSISLGPGATVLFSQTATVWIGVDSQLADCPGNGSARILATSLKLACTAYIADRDNDPPTSMVYLTIIKKTSQKGE